MFSEVIRGGCCVIRTVLFVMASLKATPVIFKKGCPGAVTGNQQLVDL